MINIEGTFDALDSVSGTTVNFNGVVGVLSQFTHEILIPARIEYSAYAYDVTLKFRLREWPSLDPPLKTTPLKITKSLNSLVRPE